MLVEERKTTRPSFQFYPNDWLNDHNLQSCSFEAQGLWINLICLLHRGVPYGYLHDSQGSPISEDDVRRLLRGIDRRTYRRLLADLSSKSVVSFDDSGVMFSRRLVRDEAKRLKQADFGKQGGNPRLKATTHKPSPSSSSSSSSSSKTTDSLEGTKPSQPEMPLEPALLTFPTVGKDQVKTWDLHQSVVDNLSIGFPALDVLAECKKALAWCHANVTRQKTPGGMKKFLFGWMERSQNSSRGGAAQTTQGVDDWKVAKPAAKN